MLNKHVHAIYDDDDKLLSAVKHLRSSGVSIKDVFTPFPVHGLDHALDLKPTRIAIAAFIYGCIGLTTEILMINYIMIIDWPQNIGGKPSFSFMENLPAFVPVIFELTVLDHSPRGDIRTLHLGWLQRSVHGVEVRFYIG